MDTQEISWYTRRNELEQGQVFRCHGGVVKLDGRVAGDGTKWTVRLTGMKAGARAAVKSSRVTSKAMCKWLTAWRNAQGTAWLAEGPSHPQQQVLKCLDEACKRFFAKAGGVPSFKRRGEEPGMRFPDPKQFSLDPANGRIKCPKLGWVRLRMSTPVTGTPRNVSLMREGAGRSARWYASIHLP